MSINKSRYAYFITWLSELFHKPMDTLRLFTIKLIKLFYGDGSKIPDKLVGDYLFRGGRMSLTESNVMKSAVLLDNLAAILKKDIHDLKLTELWGAITVRMDRVEDSEFEAFWKVMNVKHKDLPRAILQFCFDCGDITERTHFWKMNNDPQYRFAINKWLAYTTYHDNENGEN